MVRAAQQGDGAAQRAVYDRYAGLLFGIARRYARDRSEAQDFAQDAWVRIFRKLDTFGFNGSLEGWLRRVTVTVALRNIQRRGLDVRELPGSLPESHRVAPTAIARLGADELLAYIEELPEGYRLVFNLFAVEGYSHNEIAEMLDIEASTSRSQLTKARKLLQRRISQLIPVCL